CARGQGTTLLLQASWLLTKMSASTELTSGATLRPVATERSEEGGGEHGDEEECRTPTSEESKLPSLPINCPPAPRKRRRVSVCSRRRRRQPQVELIVVGAKEMEQLFQRRDQPPPPRRAKRQRRDDDK
ncbi:hypothetical protein GW17_00045434, partial [Ensete ventricosum]